MREAKANLKNGFEVVSSSTVLQTIAISLGVHDLGERAIELMISKVENDEKERAHFERNWRKIRDAIANAANYFVFELGVPKYDFLPSEPMLMVLAQFFYHNDNARPSKAVRLRIKQWFWATGVGARYTGRGYRPNITSDLSLMEELAAHPMSRGSIKVQLPIHRLIQTDYGRPGPLSNAFFCLLRANKPRSFRDGSLIPAGEISGRSSRSDKHHIFPRALLTRNEVGSDHVNSIANICYLDAETNQSIGNASPKRYLMEQPKSNAARQKALRSHFIPWKQGRGVLDQSIKRGLK